MIISLKNFPKQIYFKIKKRMKKKQPNILYLINYRKDNYSKP